MIFSCSRCAFSGSCPLFEKATEVFLDHFYMLTIERVPMIYESMGMACDRFTLEKRSAA